MKRTSNDDAFEVSDSTDWLETPLRSLAAVDSALRCQVCKDFYQTPMITSCAHTFCSLCIRRCLSNDGKCPACRTPDQELKLRNNAAIEDLVDAFKKARPDVLEHAKRPVAEAGSLSPKRSWEKAQLGEDDQIPRKRTRSSGRAPGKKSQTAGQVVIDDMEEDEDYVPETGYVLCPICERQVLEKTINSHIDRGCMDEPRITKPLGGSTARKGSAQNPFPISEIAIKRPERLPQINFSMMKEAALRKKLGDMGINAGGNRPLLERRYTEWVTLWNANCDATKPKTKADLKKELEIWERTQGGRAQTSNFGQSSGIQIKDKDFDGKAYSTANNDSFRDLIANARKKAAVKPQTSEVPGSTSHNPALPDPPISLEADVNMSEGEHGTEQHVSPVKPSDPSARFFEESDQAAKSSKPSSHFTSSRTILDKDSGISSDMPTIRPVQP